MKVALVIGHNQRQQGAQALEPIGLSEFQFYQDVIATLQPDDAPGVKFAVVTREYSGSYHQEIHKAYQQVDQWQADISIELHFNGAHPSANGTETLCTGSTESKRLAGSMQSSMLDALSLRDRGVKQVTPRDRGGLSLYAGRAPAALIEPFFGSHSSDVMAAHQLGPAGFAKMLIRGVKAYGLSAGFLESGKQPTNHQSSKLLFPKVTKAEWLKLNRKALSVLVRRTNQTLNLQHTEQLIPLTLEDVYLLFYSEAGLKNGKIDISHRHSLGERGLLPLPETIGHWVKTPIDPLNPHENVQAFIHYLGAVKNADVGRSMACGTPLYSGLFNSNQTALDQARLLAAVVHGYFYAPNYNQRLPHHLIADSIVKGQAPENLLHGLGYKHPPELIQNRLQNLKQAAKLLR